MSYLQKAHPETASCSHTKFPCPHASWRSANCDSASCRRQSRWSHGETGMGEKSAIWVAAACSSSPSSTYACGPVPIGRCSPGCWWVVRRSAKSPSPRRWSRSWIQLTGCDLLREIRLWCQMRNSGRGHNNKQTKNLTGREAHCVKGGSRNFVVG